MAYVCRVMSDADADDLAGKFLDTLNPDATFYCNWVGNSWDSTIRMPGEPDHTFMFIMAGVDSTRVVVLATWDED